jgi:hypothetical protein
MKRRTVLILGAGASSPLGFPLGGGIRNEIIEQLQNPGQSWLAKHLEVVGFDVERLKQFRRQFLLSQIPSIDGFIQAREEWEREGKAAIAAILLKAEAASKEQMFLTPDWYQTLFLALKDRENLWADHLSIITFNYDRSLEVYLVNALNAAVREDCSVLEERVKKLKILHFYGSLGDIWTERATGVEYGYNNVGRIIPAIASIHLIGRSEGAKASADEAQSLIRASQAVYFLGFGYDHENLKRLGFDGSGLWSANVIPPRLYLLSYKMEPVQVQNVEPKFGGWTFTWHFGTIADFLKVDDIFR